MSMILTLLIKARMILVSIFSDLSFKILDIHI